MSAQQVPVAVVGSDAARRRVIPGRRRAIALGVAAVGFGLVSEHANDGWFQPAWIPILDLGIGWLMVACGLIAIDTRPRQPAGGRLVLAGFLWFVGDFLAAHQFPAVSSLGFAFQGWFDLVLLLLALAFAARWPAGRVSRTVLAMAGALFAIRAVVRLAWTLPLAVGGELDPTREQVVLWVDVALAAALFAGGVVLVWRLATLPGGDRRDVAPVVAAGAASAFAAIASAQYAATTLGLVPPVDQDTLVIVLWAINVVRLVVPLAILLGVLRLRGARSAIAAAVAEVGEGASTASLERALATSLGDEGLRVLPWDEERATWLDGAHPVDEESLGALAGHQRAVVRVAADGAPVAALVVARSVTEDPELVDAGVALVRLVVRGERQAARIREQLVDVRASRARIVDAADAERRRIERDLHDGLQQRMLGLAMDLRAAEDRPEAREAALRRGSADVLALLDEVRELARGIHPAVLSEAGLGPAIQAAADRSPVPAEVDLHLAGRGSATAEATAYFVVSEALANVAKHASGASAVWIRADDDGERLRLLVEDDGPGGANAGGEGLTGLADRVAAVGGRFAVDERPGGGTSVSAELPLT
ncbi:MAG TPA: sensor histidine kinase [Candidatus Limnocylindrales bacterium]|jgi:signal transduction histidine kinase